ncbi:MAG: hypothetical protein KF908_13950 [Nitrosomonas sp.]|nr:hypothetical protein [Nitrosomonas sp.]
MKTNIGKYLTTLSILALLISGISMNAFAAQNDQEVDEHEALARQYENLAKDMQAKAQEQEEALKHKPRSSFFGRNGQHIKSHVAYKIHGYEKAAQENLAKAAYHKTMAAGLIDQNINKARIESNHERSL